MEDNTKKPIEIAERRKPMRPKYKGQSMTWRKLFIGTAILCALLAYLLLMSLKGNAVLQHEVHDRGLTAVIK